MTENAAPQPQPEPAPNDSPEPEDDGTLGALMVQWLEDFNEGKHEADKGKWTQGFVSWRWASTLLASEGLSTYEQRMMTSCTAMTRHMHGSTVVLPDDWAESEQFAVDWDAHRARPNSPTYDDSPPNWFAVEVLGLDLAEWLLNMVPEASANPEAWFAARFLPTPPLPLNQDDAVRLAEKMREHAWQPTGDGHQTDEREAETSEAGGQRSVWKEKLEEILDAELSARIGERSMKSRSRKSTDPLFARLGERTKERRRQEHEELTIIRRTVQMLVERTLDSNAEVVGHLAELALREDKRIEQRALREEKRAEERARRENNLREAWLATLKIPLGELVQMIGKYLRKKLED